MSENGLVQVGVVYETIVRERIAGRLLILAGGPASLRLKEFDRIKGFSGR